MALLELSGVTKQFGGLVANKDVSFSVREGEIVGLVTHRDLFHGALGSLDELPLSVEREVLRRRRVRDIMQTEPDTIEAEATLVEAAQMLLESKVGCLLGVEGMRLVGILTEADFVRDFVERS